MNKKIFRPILKRANLFALKVGKRLKWSRSIHYPRQVEFEIVNRCNARCIMCGDTFDGKYISVERFREYARQTLTFAERTFFIGGEPLLHPDFCELSRFAGQYDAPQYMTTNFSIFTPRHEEVVTKYFGGVTVSMDSPIDSTYETIRVGLSYSRLRENLDRLAAVKRKTGLQITIAYVAMRHNIQELAQMVDFVADYNFDGLGVSFASIRSENITFNDSLLFHRELTNKNFQLAREQAEKRGLALTLPQSFDLSRVPGVTPGTPSTYYKHCPRPWDRLRILVDGTVIPCCILYSQNMGNLEETSFRRIWNGPLYRKLRQGFRESNKHLPMRCRHCRLDVTEDSNNGMLHIPENKESIQELKKALQQHYGQSTATEK